MGIDDTDLLFFVGTNPRVDAPVINARIRRNVIHGGLEVAVLGTAPDLTYDYKHVGNSTSALQAILDGTHPFAEKLKSAELPMLVVGSDMASRTDGEALIDLVHQICEKYGVVNKEKNWNGFNVLHKDASRVGALELGISSNRPVSNKSPKLVYLLAADEIRVEDIPEDAYVIY
jgi:NADH dehydrogenase (ubiquinone) Fe-S protein 1